MLTNQATTTPVDTRSNGLGSSSSGACAEEFELLLAASQWPLDARARGRIAALANQPLDWPSFVDIVLFHRLGPLVHHNLADCAPSLVPASAMKQLQQDAASKGMGVFVSIAEILRLQRLFAAESISVRILKGIPLAILAYGDPGLRDTGDIDILIQESDISAAHNILTSLGFERLEPPGSLTPRRFAYYTAHWKDFTYIHPRTEISVELHWRLTRNPALPSEQLTAASSFVMLGSERVATLADDELFLYLCVHGALDGWMRLKSLADIAALARSLPVDALPRLALRARELGILAELSAAISLVNQFFDAGILCSELLPENDPVVALILSFSVNAITSNNYRMPRESLSGLDWVRYELGLRRSLRYRWEVLQRIFCRPRLWAAISLPDFLFYFYPLLSPLEWLHFHGFRLARDAREDR